ncbi:subtilisin-like protease SBT1.1 [Canna indica]|uniref:Subtilisin-like protease SBT1.1 n=1 Tax=Canna indica TaxID=4628 RepID=A0AAQ3KM08_9LILI|nr:subtilisin-like protease SBT1.1 [Canna indica]
MDEESLHTWYKSFLPQSSSSDNTGRLLHSYTEVFSGFAAKLTEEELENMAKQDGFLRAFPNRVLPLLTTHTPDFLGLKVGQGLWNASNLGKGVIIGVLDSGVTPDHPSFDDKGVPPPPAKWRGSCDFKSGCNNKLIGAKSFLNGTKGNPPIDRDGHGTHTSSTAVGNFVHNVSISGLGAGTAAGMAPLAHLAMYQVCDVDGCPLADILAGLDAAVKDGVDVISISLGGISVDLDKDLLTIGAFGAVEKGIFVSCAAGNGGLNYSLSNEAPWILTVAATSTNRRLRATVKLGDGKEVYGESLDQPSNFTKSQLPLYYDPKDNYCNNFASNSALGKLVVCELIGFEDPSTESLALSVKYAGGVAAIFVIYAGQGSTIIDTRSNFTSAIVTANGGSGIISQATSVTNPTAALVFDGTILVPSSDDPAVASFSSRGPSRATPGILKPDISGPGLNVIAAYIPSPDGAGDGNKAVFEILSGTSMATPHLSGVAALIKSVHPDWSPAAIKSAIMTSSDDKARNGHPIWDDQSNPASFFAMGAGHVNPAKAADPGLVYDISNSDYICYICGKFGSSGAKAIVRDGSVDCSKIKNITEGELNYPAILVIPEKGTAGDTVKRTLTNVGPASSSYKVEVKVPKTMTVTVEPRTLVFSKVNEKKSFTAEVKWVGTPPSPLGFVEGNLRWVSDKHVVRSPIVLLGPSST